MKKALLIILTLALMLSISIIIMMRDYIKHTDISLYPVKNSSKTYKKEKTWLVSYASGDVYIQNQNNLNMSASMTRVFDVIVSSGPHDIDPEFYQKYKEVISQKRGVISGYYVWKPYIILKTLKMMPENDILFYADCTAIIRDEISKILKLSEKHDIVLFPGNNTNRKYMQKAMIDKMMNGDESIRDKAQLEGGFLLLRNNAKTREFIAAWLKDMEDLRFLDAVKDKDEYNDFVDHRHDQAILSAIYYIHPERYHLYKLYPARTSAFFVARRRSAECSLQSITFNKKLAILDWFKENKFLLKLENSLIGCQDKDYFGDLESK